MFASHDRSLQRAVEKIVDVLVPQMVEQLVSSDLSNISLTFSEGGGGTGGGLHGLFSQDRVQLRCVGADCRNARSPGGHLGARIVKQSSMGQCFSDFERDGLGEFVPQKQISEKT